MKGRAVCAKSLQITEIVQCGCSVPVEECLHSSAASAVHCLPVAISRSRRVHAPLPELATQPFAKLLAKDSYVAFSCAGTRKERKNNYDLRQLA